MVYVFDVVMDEVDDYFDEGLEFFWYVVGCFFSNVMEYGKEQQIENY